MSKTLDEELTELREAWLAFLHEFAKAIGLYRLAAWLDKEGRGNHER